MTVQELAATSARLSCVTERSRAELEKAIAKWFATQFVTGMKLPLLRAMYHAEVYPIYSRMLANSAGQDLLKVLKSVDKHRSDMLTRSNSEIMRHLEDLASGAIEPAPKARTPSKGKTTGKAANRSPRSGSSSASDNGRKRKTASKPVGIFSTSKY